MKKEFTYSVSGVIRRYADGRPLPGLRVRAYDKDFFRDQFLGEAKSDKNGHYTIRFRREELTGPIILLERHPDIFILVYDENDRLIYTTENSIVIDADRHTTIDINLRVPAVSGDGISYLQGVPVSLKYVAKLKPKDLVNAYRLMKRPNLKVDNLELILKAFPDLLHKHKPLEDCGEGRADVIRLLLKERRAEHLLDESDADDFEGGVDIKWFYTTNIAVKYTLDTDSASALTGTFADLPAADSAFALPDGTPIGTVRVNLADLHADNTEVAPVYVQKVALIAEYALTTYLSAAYNFRDPRNGATRLEYRILVQDVGVAGSTNSGISHVEVDIDNSDTQNFGTVPHEMFHQVQYRYNTNGTADGKIRGSIIEGGARLLEDCIWDTPNRYVQSAANDGIFPTPEESLLDLGGAKTPIRYAAGLFWKYFAEHHSENTGAASEPGIGIETFRYILEETASDTTDFTIEGLRKAHNRMPWYGDFDRFNYYDAALTELSSHETAWGNYLLANYLHVLMAPGDADHDQRFDYLEDDDAATTVLNTLTPAVDVNNQISMGQGDSVTRNVAGHKPLAAVYYEIVPDAASLPRMMRVNFTVTSGMTDPLVQIVRLGAGEELVDVHRSDQGSYSKTINMSGLEKVVVIVGSREDDGDYTITFDEVASATDVMVTRWNSRVGTEYQFDPKGYAWHWISPDIMVDNDDDLLDDVAVYFGQNNKLKVRLRNRGNADANDIQIEFWYQNATAGLSSAGWIPVQDSADVTQILTGISLAAGDEDWYTVNWSPDDDGSGSHHYCVKVLVTVAGDPNTDNKMAFRNFGNLETDADADKDIWAMLRTFANRKSDLLQLIPRTKNFQLEIVNPDSMKPADGSGRKCDCRSRIIIGVPDDIVFAQLRLKKVSLKPWDGRNTIQPVQSKMYYPTDPRSLPPGIRSDELITLAHTVDNRLLGGVTYRVPKK